MEVIQWQDIASIIGRVFNRRTMPKGSKKSSNKLLWFTDCFCCSTLLWIVINPMFNNSN